MRSEIKIEDIGSHIIFSIRIKAVFSSIENLQFEQIFFTVLLKLSVADGSQQTAFLLLADIVRISHYISCNSASYIQYPVITYHRRTPARFETIGNILDRHVQLKSRIFVIEQWDIQIKQPVVVVHTSVAILYEFCCLRCRKPEILR